MNRLKQPLPWQRNIPSVDRIVRELAEINLPRALVVAVVRRELAGLRGRKVDEHVDQGQVMRRIRCALEVLRRQKIQPVINATGIIIHTNLGRSPMGDRVVQTISSAASNFTNLEYDLGAGERGSRGLYVENALAVLCLAEAAAVVNNCAAALLLVLRHFTSDTARREVVISRGELVQIGGGFRIPEILESAGAVLREIGTTNKTAIEDYRRAIGPDTAMILKVHHSNFYMEGFVESPACRQIAALARRAKVPFLADLGSGAVFDTTELGPEREPMPQSVLADGADLVCFSGDKLLGGPQAGIIVGSAAYISALKKNPMSRALRCDKLILAALEATVDLLLSGELDQIPVRSMMNADVAQLRKRAGQIILALSDLPLRAEIGAGCARVGGGALPRTRIESVTVDLQTRSVRQFEQRLRCACPPVIGYCENDCLRLDLRTVFPTQDTLLIAAIRGTIQSVE